MSNRFAEIRDATSEQIRKFTTHPELPTLDAFIKQATLTGGQYGVAPTPLVDIERQVGDLSADIAATFNRHITAHFGAICTSEDGPHLLPESVKALLFNDLKRICQQLEIFPDSFYRLSNEPYLKDLAIVRNRMIPLGVEYAEIEKRLWRGLIFRGSLRQTIQMLTLLLRKGAAGRQFVSLHLHSSHKVRLDEQECKHMYRRLAELLILNPQINGMVSSSWFVDPAMKIVSPHLAHLRELPETNGAYIFFVRQESSNSGALTSSRTRRRMFESGKYQPATYMRVWLRDDILEWHYKEKYYLVDR